ncbi:MAG: peptidoglycan editing factor PgeF [Chloroflexota bacterium]|nr:peptidoglycan editing factor PgeF [Chloroflexota bacterium]
MGFIEKDGLRYYQFDLFNGQPIFHAVLTRNGGFSQGPYASLNTGGTVGDDPDAVLKNHERIYDVLDYPFESRFDVWQVHGARVICTDEPREMNALHTKADGILTDRADVTLFMRFADCVPILLYDPVQRAIGIAHAGWQGTAKQIAGVTVAQMAACYGSEPADILAGIGPSICQDCYAVGPEVREAFSTSFGEAESAAFFDQRNGARTLDLWEANRATLEAAGVSKIEIAGLCTAEHLGDWYSHRAENGMTGRFAVLMAIDHN